MPPFTVQTVATHWESAPVVTAAVAVSAGLYLWGAWRVGRRHPARPWPWWRSALFLGGLAVVVIAIQSGIGAYDDVLFWDHMVQHLMLLMIAPPMLVAGQPVTLLLHASRNPLHSWAKRAVRSRVVTFLTWPPFTVAFYTATVAGTHLTNLAQLTHANQALHNAEHVLYLFAGYLFFMAILGKEPIRWRLSYPVRVLILALSMPVDTFTGLLLGYEGRAYALGVAGARPPGSPSPVEDVHWAGAVMWVGGDAIMFAFMMLVVWMWSRDTTTASLSRGWLEAARKSRFEELVASQAADAGRLAGQSGPGRGGIDDDEHLAAYNAYLARLNATRPASPGPEP
ncbi:MAG TPA: cytochrome c oxidase assembly protein [Streptosporangiaceae bacterium]|nr:cytochrome c oxidase assembly protein [Streptosporangiaceae bacterium]